jgi:hypothetical protein
MEKMLDDPSTPCLPWLAVVQLEVGMLPSRLHFGILRLAFRALRFLRIGDTSATEGSVMTWRGWWLAARTDPRGRFCAEIERLAMGNFERGQQLREWKRRALKAEGELDDLKAWREAGCPDPQQWVKDYPLG